MYTQEASRSRSLLLDQKSKVKKQIYQNSKLQDIIDKEQAIQLNLLEDSKEMGKLLVIPTLNIPDLERGGIATTGYLANFTA